MNSLAQESYRFGPRFGGDRCLFLVAMEMDLEFRWGVRLVNQGILDKHAEKMQMRCAGESIYWQLLDSQDELDELQDGIMYSPFVSEFYVGRTCDPHWRWTRCEDRFLPHAKKHYASRYLGSPWPNLKVSS